ncbi:predicted protein [Sparassis crispa]|uniref:Origin recognition complex subunit 5 n=1 Tax=Sparassis crispa TaxID=139825 RepID=A0A401GQZ5_9APHY|nr:predicted protein [Sparassis crispa]GBE84648.1 predicted protein [Sparassis crispa]
MNGFTHSLHEDIALSLSTLLNICPPPFIFIYDPEAPKITSSAVRSVLSTLSDTASTSKHPVKLTYAFVNAVSCFTPRLFYDTVLNAVACWQPSWEDGSANWSGADREGQRWNENLDTFLHGLMAVHSQLESEAGGPSPQSTRKGKGKAKEAPLGIQQKCRLVLFVERAERLKENLPDLLVPLTRLAELARVDVVTILLSHVRWEDLRPPLGASPEPYYMDVPALSKQATLDILASSFPSSPTPPDSSLVDADTYNLSLRPLYIHFIATLYSICSPFTDDPHELAYIAAAFWPGFVKPVLDEHRRKVQEFRLHRATRMNGNHRGEDDEDVEIPDSEDERMDDAPLEEPELGPPTEDTRIRLIRLFTPSFTTALEALYPRLTSAAAWVRMHAAPANILALPPGQASSAMPVLSIASEDTGEGLGDLPRLAKFVLVAAFLASTNPPKSDIRMFGRGPDERTKRRRRKGGSPRKVKPGTTGGSVKIPQRLLGPTTFPLDRLLAILGVLLEEHDVEMRPPAPQYSLPGEYTDMEISRVALYAEIMELASMRLLLRTSPPDKLDMAPTFKCGISYEVALRLSRDVGVMLNDLMWDPV